LKKDKTRYIVAVLDAVVVAAAWCVAWAIRWPILDHIPYPYHSLTLYLKAVPAVVAIWLVTARAVGLYPATPGIYRIDELKRVILGAFIAFIATLAAVIYFRQYDFARWVVFISAFLAGFGLYFNRKVMGKIRRALHARGVGRKRILIYGAGVTGIRLARYVAANPGVGLEVVGFIDDDRGKANLVLDGVRVLGTGGDLKRVINEKGVSDVYLAIPSFTGRNIVQVIERTDNRRVAFKVVSNLFASLTGPVNVEEIPGLPIIDIKSTELRPFQWFMKEFLDKTCAVILILLFLPIWAVIAVGIKLDSKGPVLFRQRRVGLNGREFNMYKFRTMFPTVPKYQEAPKGEEDIRLTRFGKVLRKLALDETPQLINVLQGKLSIVGPRPEMPFVVATYNDWQRRRLSVRPGITGLWQIIGRKDLPMHENLDYDFYYIQNQSPLLDLVIILKSIPIIFFRRPPY
jgi:exopolysaccharide biosynthesis polyprenyl glycosylphosphotransferase